MKFSCNTIDLLKGLSLVSRAISGQQALPILGNVLIQVEGKRCILSATDLELSIITSFDAVIENEGSITVPAKAIINFAQYNSDPEVLLEIKEGTQLKCTSKTAKTIISGEIASEYPTISPIEKENSFTLDALPFLEALNKVTFSSAKTTLRPVLSGVYLKIENGELTLVSTDSYRLSEYTIATGVSDTDVNCIIPTKVLEELKSILGSITKADKEEPSDKETKENSPSKQEGEKVQVILSNQQIEIQIKQTQLLSRLIDGKFPNYKQIIPKETKTTVGISIRELSTVVKRMHYFAKEINNNLTLSITNEGLHISTPQTQAGQDEATLSVEVSGEDNKIALSSSYLQDFLSHTEGDIVTLKLTDSMHPAVFHLPTNDKYLHLIMPLRIQED